MNLKGRIPLYMVLLYGVSTSDSVYFDSHTNLDLTPFFVIYITYLKDYWQYFYKEKKRNLQSFTHKHLVS